jgi:hypothetical protein
MGVAENGGLWGWAEVARGREKDPRCAFPFFLWAPTSVHLEEVSAYGCKKTKTTHFFFSGHSSCHLHA